MQKLSIVTHPAASHFVFGWLNLVWPNITFWIAVIVIFFVLAWARIPLVMEADAESRRNGAER